jgi:aryl-alcohol dehydrogenase-like predicted oxidoreductase
MELREAGSSGLKLSVVGFGCWQLGQKGEADYWGTEVSQVTANELVKQAFESGVSCSIMHTTTRSVLLLLHPALAHFRH